MAQGKIKNTISSACTVIYIFYIPVFCSISILYNNAIALVKPEIHRKINLIYCPVKADSQATPFKNLRNQESKLL